MMQRSVEEPAVEPPVLQRWLSSRPRLYRETSDQNSARSTDPTPPLSIWDVCPGTNHALPPVYHVQCVPPAYHTYPAQNNRVLECQTTSSERVLHLLAAPAGVPEEAAEAAPRCLRNPASSPILLQTSHDQLIQRRCPLQHEIEFVL